MPSSDDTMELQRELRAEQPAETAWDREDVSTGKGEADENFPVGSVLFARPQRAHIHAYYAFARAADDVSDSETLPPEAKISRLDAMEAVLRGQAEAPDRADAQSAVALRRSMLQTGLPFEVATDLLVAFREDATKTRYANWGELARYCRYSANPVGRFLLSLHGESEGTLAASDALCTSLQVLNHLQDCAKDLAALDRCYMPLDLMGNAGLTVDALREPRESPALRRVFSTLLDHVDALNATAATLPRMVRDRRMRMYCAVVVALAHRLARLLRQGDPLAARVTLHKADFAKALLKGFGAW